MTKLLTRANQGAGTQMTRGQQAADRLARYGWIILRVAVILALLGGVVTAAMWQPGIDNNMQGGMPGLPDLPFVVPMLGYLLVIILGLPSLLVGSWAFLHGSWAAGSRWLLPFVGPVLFLVGTEIVPHLLNPCFWAFEVGSKRLSEFYCAYNPEWGVDVADRWHLLDHTLVGALPMAALYWLALRKWRPSIVQFHKPKPPGVA